MGMPAETIEPAPTGPTGQLWRLPAVEIQTGLKKSEIYRRVKLGAFPPPIKLGKKVAVWSSVAIESWIKSMIQQGGK